MSMITKGDRKPMDVSKGYAKLPGTGCLRGKFRTDGEAFRVTMPARKVCLGKASGSGGGITVKSTKRVYTLRVVGLWQFANGTDENVFEVEVLDVE